MLEVKNLTFKVKENGIDRSIVEDISFTVENGEMLVITGPNGGGKSVTGFLPASGFPFRFSVPREVTCVYRQTVRAEY